MNDFGSVSHLQVSDNQTSLIEQLDLVGNRDQSLVRLNMIEKR